MNPAAPCWQKFLEHHRIPIEYETIETSDIKHESSMIIRCILLGKFFGNLWKSHGILPPRQVGPGRPTESMDPAAASAMSRVSTSDSMEVDAGGMTPGDLHGCFQK